MRAFKIAMIEFALVGMLGLVVGFGVNAVRTRGSIQLTKNYFAVAPSEPVADTAAVRPAPAGSRRASHDATQSASGTGASGDAATPGIAPPAPAATPESPYPVLSPAEVIEIFNDPDSASGLNVFIDARSDTAFEDGHIPGAVQFYPYEADRFLDKVLLRTNGALRVIVYCNGGDCADSKFACRELLEAGLPQDALFLFAEGWEAWTARAMPVATGPEE